MWVQLVGLKINVGIDKCGPKYLIKNMSAIFHDDVKYARGTLDYLQNS